MSGRRIREARDHAVGGALTRAQLASKAKLTVSRLGNYEQGTRKLPISVAKAMQRVTGFPAAYLMGLIDEADRDLLMAPSDARASLLRAIKQLSDPLHRTGSD